MGFARWTLLAVCAASLACAEEEAPPPGGVETLDSVAKAIFDALQSGDMKRMSPLLPLTADIEWLSKQPGAVSFGDESAETTATRFRRATLNMVRAARADSRLDWSKAVLTGRGCSLKDVLDLSIISIDSLALVSFDFDLHCESHLRTVDDCASGCSLRKPSESSAQEDSRGVEAGNKDLMDVDPN